MGSESVGNQRSIHVTLIAALSDNGVIGRQGGLPWRLSSDLRRFKKITMGQTVLVGRKTFESLPRTLHGRRLIVLSRQSDYRPQAADLVSGFDEARQLAASAGAQTLFVMGGAEVYRLALPHADRLLLTRVHAHVEGDAKFPHIEPRAWQLIETSQRFEPDEKNEFPYSFETYERVSQ